MIYIINFVTLSCKLPRKSVVNSFVSIFRKSEVYSIRDVNYRLLAPAVNFGTQLMKQYGSLLNT